MGFKDIQTITTNTITKNPITMTYTLLLWGTIFYLIDQIDTNYDEKYTKEYSKYFTPKWLYALQFVPIFIMMNILVNRMIPSNILVFITNLTIIYTFVYFTL